MNKYMSSPNALSRRQRKGPTHDHYSDDEDDSINMPISLNLGGNVFEYKNESWRRGRWISHIRIYTIYA